MITFRSPIPDGERILLYGTGGVGKTRALLSILRKCPDAKGYIIDNDNSYTRMIHAPEPYGFRDLVDRVHINRMDKDDWKSIIPTIRDMHRQMNPWDWFGFDSVTPTWMAVRNHFAQITFGMDIEDYELQVRAQREQRKRDGSYDKKKDSGSSLDGWEDWGIINPMYSKLYTELMKCPGNQLWTAEEDKYDGSSEKDKTVRETLSGFSMKPKGQKSMIFIPHTVIYMFKVQVPGGMPGSPQFEWRMSTVKDRERYQMLNEPCGDFMDDYLRRVAGWQAAVTTMGG